MEGNDKSHNESDRILIKVSDAARMLSVSKSKLYELINEGTVPAIRVGQSLRIPLEWLHKWVAEQLEPLK